MSVSADVLALVRDLTRYNEAYRQGEPLLSDEAYDLLVERLRSLAPDHPFLHWVEPERFEGRAEIRHPAAMLSMEKAYTAEDLARFVARVEKEATEIGAAEVQFRVRPKLDGLAGMDYGTSFATRGNGVVGYEVSQVFDKGMVAVGGRGQGPGEMVISKSYFDEHMAEAFVHPRNLVVGIVSSDTVNDAAREALEDGAVRFVPYASLPFWAGTGEELLRRMDEVGADLAGQVDYALDGMVVEVVDEDVRVHMGATSHHYRWQIAVKRKGETAETRVLDIEWNTGRTGKVTPVLLVEPVALSGATIRRVTAHNPDLLKSQRAGVGARVEIVRSGEVIPKLEFVLEPSDDCRIPEFCPSCGSALSEAGIFLVCPNAQCPAQVGQGIEHWFKTLGTADWFGPKAVARMVAGGYDSLPKVYAMTEKDFLDLGFGPVQTANLIRALEISRTKPVEDWRFLAALGIPDLGPGDSRKLLARVTLTELERLEESDVLGISGFGPITSQSIVRGLRERQKLLAHLTGLGFRLLPTPLTGESAQIGPLAGKAVVFTGKMAKSREEMEQEARAMGAMVQSAVSKKTDILVCGDKVGPAKMDKARRLGVRILAEAEYRDEIAGQPA
ncbi:MAG: DNA ligase [Deltaproteobacteria bacterium]|nr:DNA ligase [Deltaproteobacteria bacterium]